VKLIIHSDLTQECVHINYNLKPGNGGVTVYDKDYEGEIEEGGQGGNKGGR